MGYNPVPAETLSTACFLAIAFARAIVGRQLLEGNPCFDRLARDRGFPEGLGLLGLPFLFFIDAAQGRASVLYHRYDGHYGLITPAG